MDFDTAVHVVRCLEKLYNRAVEINFVQAVHRIRLLINLLCLEHNIDSEVL